MKTIRGRLTLWYIVSTVITYFILAGIFSVLLWVSLHDQIDHHIHVVTGQAEQVVEKFTGEDRNQFLQNFVSVPGMAVVLISETGEVVFETQSTDVAPFDSSQIERIQVVSQQTGHHPYHFTIEDMRFGTALVKTEGQNLVLIVGYTESILRQTFVQMMVITLAVMLLLLLLFGFVGYELLKKYLRPLEKISHKTSQIKQPKQLSLRLQEEAPTEELQEIVSAFNSMLSRLENVFKTEHEFFSQAAHTLKTPLAVLRAKIDGFSKYSQVQKNELKAIIDEAVETIHDLLFISRLETDSGLQLETVKISSLVAEYVELAKSLGQERQVMIQSNIEPALLIRANTILVKRAIGNIIHNAVEYVNDSGEINIQLSQKDDVVVLVVENSGRPIGKKEQLRVYERFYRGKNVRENTKGSGLGLAIAKAIMDNLGGTIKFQNNSRGVTKIELHFI